MFLNDDTEFTEEMLDDTRFTDGVTLFTKISNELQYGRQLDEIGKLSQMDRMLYEEQDFFFAGTKVFKKIDPIEQALDGDAGHDIVDAEADERREWELKLAEQVDPDYDDAMNYIVEQPLEDVHAHAHVSEPEDNFKVISIDFTSLTGQFVALGYSPPRDKYKFIGNFAPNRSMMKAYLREERTKQLVWDIKRTSTLRDLNRIIVSFKEDYDHDRDIRQSWSKNAMTKARLKREATLRKCDSDEETIRQSLWKEFDKKPGKFISKGRQVKSYGSKWHRNRSRAYQALLLTYMQWQDTYTAINERRAYFTVDCSERIYRTLEREVNKSKNIKELQDAHGLIEQKCDDLNKEHKQRIWKIWGIKAKQRGLRGQKYYG